MHEPEAAEQAFKNGYNQGMIDGVQRLAEDLKNYYNHIGGQTFGALVAYTIDQKVEEFLNEKEH